MIQVIYARQPSDEYKTEKEGRKSNSIKRKKDEEGREGHVHD
jgi:hypothetical protein